MKEIYLMVKDDAQGMYVIESGKKYPLGPGGSDKPHYTEGPRSECNQVSLSGEWSQAGSTYF